jgi:hypothetical protein
MFKSWILIIVALIVLPVARADIVVDWNLRANTTMEVEGPRIAGNPLAMARTLAIMHAAMSDAINVCDPAFTTYLADLPKRPGASASAAAHAAARAVLVTLYPKQLGVVDQQYLAALATLPDGEAKAAGIEAGMQVARLLLALRENDGMFDGADTYRPATAPGAYVPTALPVVNNVASRKPFSLHDITQFRPGPPPSLHGGVWARDFNETRAWGAAHSVRRDAAQTETARFWEQLGPPAWNQVARSLSASQPLPLADNARAFALLNIAMFDSYLAVFDAKYHYNFWRPITAIRNGDRDGNPATERDASWKPLLDTPPHPEYPCAHCAADGAAATILRSVYGSRTAAFTVVYGAMPDVVRKYQSVQAMQEDIFIARIWGGVHFRNSNAIGETLGTKVGAYVLDRTLLRAEPQLQR